MVVELCSTAETTLSVNRNGVLRYESTVSDIEPFEEESIFFNICMRNVPCADNMAVKEFFYRDAFNTELLQKVAILSLV